MVKIQKAADSNDSRPVRGPEAIESSVPIMYYQSMNS